MALNSGGVDLQDRSAPVLTSSFAEEVQETCLQLLQGRCTCTYQDLQLVKKLRGVFTEREGHCRGRRNG